MGYSTDFYGTLQFNKPVAPWLKEYINKFSYTRRMMRDNEKIKELFPNWGDLCFNGDLGSDGEYFIGGEESFGQREDGSIIEYNYPAKTQPGLWCQWIVNDNGELEWDGGEKFYNYVEWLDYLIEHFFEPLGYILDGDIEWQGESHDDYGTIHVVENMVEVRDGVRLSALSELGTEELIAELKHRGFEVTPIAV